MWGDRCANYLSGKNPFMIYTPIKSSRGTLSITYHFICQLYFSIAWWGEEKAKGEIAGADSLIELGSSICICYIVLRYCEESGHLRAMLLSSNNY